MSKQIPLTKGYFAIVDDDDYEWLNQWKWQYCKSRKTGYAVRTIQRDGKKTGIKMHRVLLDAPDELQVDHIDRNGLNNQRNNLRLATSLQNSRNSRSRMGTSLYKGVCLYKNRAWASQIRTSERILHLGYFPTQWEAAQAYNDAARKYFGEFAVLNQKFSDSELKDAPLYDAATRTTSIYTGVFYRKNQNRWRAYISINKKRIWLGQFDTELKAARTYDDFVKEHKLDRSLNLAT